MSFDGSVPLCARACVYDAALASTCDLQFKCLCQDSTYLKAWHACIDTECDAADQALWIQSGLAVCQAFGITYTATGTVDAQSTASVGVTAPGNPVQTSVAASPSVIVATSIPGGSAGSPQSSTFQAVPSVATSAANGSPVSTPGSPAGTTAANNAPTSSPSAISPITQTSSDSGLSTGVKAGIAVGAVVIALLVAAVVFLLWRRKKQPRQEIPPETTTTVHEVGNWGVPPADKEVKTGTVPIATVIASPRELSGEKTALVQEIVYNRPPAVPELPPEHCSPPPPWSSPVPPAATELSPSAHLSASELSPSTSSPYKELTSSVPSEMGSSPRPSPAQTVPIHSRDVQEVDGTAMSHSAAPMPSELGGMGFPTYHELSSLPAEHGSFAAQELSSSPIVRGAVPDSHAGGASGVGGSGTGVATSAADAGIQDAELERMKQEIENVRKEKESVQRLRALEEREAELSRSIVARELSRGGGGGQ